MKIREITERFQSQNPGLAGGATSKFKKAKAEVEALGEDLECTDTDPCGYCKKCKERGTLKVSEGQYEKQIRQRNRLAGKHHGTSAWDIDNDVDDEIKMKKASSRVTALKNRHRKNIDDIMKDAGYVEESEDTLNPPSIDVGDEVKTGKFKNSKATVKGFKKDDHNQPVLKTNKGDKKLFNLRLSKLQK